MRAKKRTGSCPVRAILISGLFRGHSLSRFLPYLDQLDRKVERLVRHLMVAVECDSLVIDGRNHCVERSSESILEHHLISGSEVFRPGDRVSVDRDHEHVLMMAVGVFRLEMHLDLFARLELSHRAVKALYHLAYAAYEFQRDSPLIARLELLAVIEGADIVDFHSPAYVLPLEEVLRLAASRASGASARIGASAAAGLIVMMLMTVIMTEIVVMYEVMDAIDSHVDEIASEP